VWIVFIRFAQSVREDGPYHPRPHLRSAWKCPSAVRPVTTMRDSSAGGISTVSAVNGVSDGAETVAALSTRSATDGRTGRAFWSLLLLMRRARRRVASRRRIRRRRGASLEQSGEARTCASGKFGFAGNGRAEASAARSYSFDSANASPQQEMG